VSAGVLECEVEYRDTLFTAFEQPSPVRHTSFYGCTFDDGRLKGVAFEACRFLDCAFVACDVSLATLGGSELRDVSFDACNLTGIAWTRAAQPPTGALEVDFRDCILDFGDFSGCNLEARRLDHCLVRECDLRGTRLLGAVCRGSDFAGSAFEGADLTEADLRLARNYVIDVRSTTVRGARVSLPDAAALLRGLEVEVD
jgi:uncharacterized protein YjbI with pentapeptide repeats